MAHSVYIDRLESGEIEVAWYAGASPRKAKTFPASARAEAEAFAMGKMGKRQGMVLSTLDMSAEQLAEHRRRQAGAAQLAEDIRRVREARGGGVSDG